MIKRIFCGLVLSLLADAFSPNASSFAQTALAPSRDFPVISIVQNNNPCNDKLFLALSQSGYGYLLVLDNELTPVLKRKVEGTLYDFKVIPGELMMFNVYPDAFYAMDKSGTIVSRFKGPQNISLDIHDLKVLADGSYYIIGKEMVSCDMRKYVADGFPDAIIVANTLYHMDAQGNELWRWRSFENYDIMDADDRVALNVRIIDWTHCNSIEVCDDGNILLSTRNFNEITKINRATGAIMWRFGGKKNQFRFIGDERKFSRQHTAQIKTNGDLQLFDNGNFLSPQYSSVVEYRMDEARLQATLVRRYVRGDSVFTASMGSVQELSNGNNLICWGESESPAITEVNPEGGIEYELAHLTPTFQYRAYRFPWETDYVFTDRDTVAFDTVSLGESSMNKIIVRNLREDVAIINQLMCPDSAFNILTGLPLTIPHDGSAEITVQYHPSRTGCNSTKLNIRFVSDTLLVGKQVQLLGTCLDVPTGTDNSRALRPYAVTVRNYPNPFNPSTVISFQLPEQQHVELKVFDVLGNEVALLASGMMTAGNHEARFHANALSSGVYYYILKAEKKNLTGKMLLLK